MSVLSRFSTVPCRYFGRGRKFPTFGHGPIPRTNSFFDRWAPRCIVFLGIITFTNWRYVLKDLLGIPIVGKDSNFIVRFLCLNHGISEELVPMDVGFLDNKAKCTAYIDDLRLRELEVKEYLISRARRFYNEEDAKSLEKEIRELDFSDSNICVLFRSNISPSSIPKDSKYDRARTLINNLVHKGSILQFFNFDVKAEDENLAAEVENFKKEVTGFNLRDRQIIDYENRVRQYSTPDKIFRYFATIKVVDEKGHFEVMMTPQDFLRSLTPGEKQPEAYGLDSYSQISPDEMKILTPDKIGVDRSSIFHHFGACGLISFSDYIFLLTVLGTSSRHFEIAFKMFDLNGDGNVDVKEFEFVTNLMKSQSSVGTRHRDHQASTFKGINSGLISYLFGAEKNKLLHVETFTDFQKTLQREILVLEFKKKSRGDEFISDNAFADLLITYAGFNPTKKQRFIKRLTNLSDTTGITLDEYLNFYQVLYNISDVDASLTFYHIAGAPIERKTLRHVARAVAGIELTDHLLDVVFTLFDDNGDGKLSNKEFISVMKQRAMRGLEKPKDTGAGKMFNAIMKCSKYATLAQY
uniref:Calcium uptake protein 1 homolog, mitochondriallike [Bombyx mori] n=1 Tax=Lepeophtheirus salmonis TaxID=72036 RepID=A0A0K2TJ33_LEPSM